MCVLCLTENGPVTSTAVAVERLVDAARLWAVQPGGDTGPVIRAAAEALAVGVEGPDLLALASKSEGPTDWDFQDVLRGTLAELGQPFNEPGSDSAQVAAAGALARQVLRGELTPREFASWAHWLIGHQGASELQSLVNIEDVYDGVDEGWGTGSTEDLDVQVMQLARELAQQQ